MRDSRHLHSPTATTTVHPHEHWQSIPDRTGLLFSFSLFDDLPDSVVICDPPGHVQYLNHSAARLFSTSPTRVLGRPLAELLTLLDGISQRPIHDPLAFLLAISDAEQNGPELLLARRHGTPLPVDCTIGPIRNRSGHAPAGLVLLIRDASRTRARIAQLVEAARHDEHTRLLRRGELERRLARVLQGMQPGDEHALLFMDLDHFKSINDNAGHMAGDRALREVAEQFRANVRDRDTLARLGGDEFGLLLEHCPLGLARERAQILQLAVATHAFRVGAHTFELAVSIGIAAVRGTRYDVSQVIAAADTACYAAKRLDDTTLRLCETVLD